jgi:hypothetical protein
MTITSASHANIILNQTKSPYMNKTPELFDQRNDKKKEIEFHASKSLQVDV